MGVFERFLSVWVALAIIAGTLLGNVFPAIFEVLSGIEFAQVNLIIAVLIWLMIYPVMVQVNFESITQIAKEPKGLILTVVINWLVKPFTMALVGWLFFKGVFADFIQPETANEYLAGVILLGVAPCTAMVFIWSQLTKGDASYTLVQVSVNDVIMIFAFAPIAALLLGITDIIVPWQTLLLSVGLYVVAPLIAGLLTRQRLKSKATSKQHNVEAALQAFDARMKPWSIVGLLLTVVLLFGFQAEVLLTRPLDIAMIATPLLIQTYGIFAITFIIALLIKLPYRIAAPACLIGTSNFFELAVAVAISLFGLQSGAALATVVGVLVEVPVMLSLVWFANKTKHWFTSS
ncbi:MULTISPECIES: ACR3 family arsenite efflux transporter [Idiomarina]|uniref:ACR3 family arsenite efflux transporter n=1 Tax=Idiomarina TaxID=135575 RepID=UPI000C6A0851|nr:MULTISPECIES: ACR3 family arsenite efflux transporter [Idiomarina]MBH94056.1 arsenical-resistance protein [Idiomarina sp.]|tara:strand:+ start:481 stop:1521 length:1041 start_codon:yes stop_codon:yes gene_type:complete